MEARIRIERVVTEIYLSDSTTAVERGTMANMRTKLHKVARLARGVAAPALAAAVAKIVNFDVHMIAALAAVALIVTVLITETENSALRISGLCAALLILPLGIWTSPPPKPPSVDDLTLYLVPDRIAGDRLYGRISVQDSTTERMRITDSHLVVGAWSAANDTNPERVVNPGKSTEFEIDHPNDLALRGGEVTLTFNAAFGDKPQSPQSAEAVFDVPASPTIGKGIPVRSCCRTQPKDVYQMGLDEIQRRLDLDDSYVEIPNATETDSNGSPIRISIPRAMHGFFVTDGIVTFRSFQNGGWRQLQLPFQQTTDHKHFIKFDWNDRDGISWLVVDNAGVVGSTKYPRVAYVSASELLGHEK